MGHGDGWVGWVRSSAALDHVCPCPCGLASGLRLLAIVLATEALCNGSIESCIVSSSNFILSNIWV